MPPKKLWNNAMAKVSNSFEIYEPSIILLELDYNDITAPTLFV